MKKINSLLIFAMIILSTSASADECEKAEALKWIREGKTVSELRADVGREDFFDSFVTKNNGKYVRNDTYSYYPACSNQTIYIFNAQEGQIVSVERKIKR
jgi:hypothetical protein